jgi:HEPN domain-containing protein
MKFKAETFEMIDEKKQIEYWINTAEDDLITAELLLRENRIVHGLFFCHLVIEKAFKALFVKINKDHAPKSHNLIYLAEKTSIELDDEKLVFMGILMKYQLQGRYPDYDPEIPTKELSKKYFQKTESLLKWLKAKL